MSRIVQKYGGSSVATTDLIRSVARRVARVHDRGTRIVGVVSAMGDTTDDLIDLANSVSSDPYAAAREMDMLLTAGERISMAVVAMAINDLGEDARSYTGSQAGLITDSTHGKARIVDLCDCLRAGREARST